MTTLNQLVYDSLSTIQGTGRYSDDSLLSQEQVEFSVINNRNFLIRQDQNKGRSLSDNVTQTLPCVEFISVDASECCDTSTECTVLRSKLKIPKPIELYQRDLITRVSGNDITGTSFSFMPYARFIRSGISKWTKNSAKATLKNGYIYIINPPFAFSKGSITGVFEDPREAGQHFTCTGSPCYTNDMAFPISSHMIPLLKELVLKDLKIQVSVPSDFKGDEEGKTESQQRNA